MDGAKGLGELMGERLKELREEREISQEDFARRAQQVGLPWSAVTVEAFETGKRKSVALEELILLSYAFRVEPGEWFVGNGWADLAPDAMASLGVIRSILAGSPTDSWIRISERRWDLPEFSNAPGVLGAQFERLNDRIEVARRYLGGDVPTEVAIKAVEAATHEVEVKVARRFHVEPLQVSLEAFKNWGRGLTQERDRRFGEEARKVSFRSLSASRGHITRLLLKELAPKLKQKKLKAHFLGLQIES
ncbi:MAG TPA: helix-turn-helix transcriptional regulator [Actinomycetota bacterium]|nr:helix-turn-helix transcriptional regulator [Actinomycetota bacterium]